MRQGVALLSRAAGESGVGCRNRHGGDPGAGGTNGRELAATTGSAPVGAISVGSSAGAARVDSREAAGGTQIRAAPTGSRPTGSRLTVAEPARACAGSWSGQNRQARG